MKYIKKIEKFTSPYTKNIDTRPITFYKKIAWLFPTDIRFKNLFNSTKPLNLVNLQIFFQKKMKNL